MENPNLKWMITGVILGNHQMWKHYSNLISEKMTRIEKRFGQVDQLDMCEDVLPCLAMVNGEMIKYERSS